MARTLIPRFYLYGEPHRLADEDFVHVEALSDRSRPSEWTIQPHSHAELNHVFVVVSGGGAMTADGRDIYFQAPCFVLIPATVVHGFQWLEETEGFVITMANSYVMELGRCDRSLAALFEQSSAIPLGSDNVVDPVDNLMRELGWSAPGHRAAVTATILSLLVMGLRHRSAADQPPPPEDAQAATVARLRERIEQRFRLREPVSSYAADLGVSQTALRIACAKIAGRSPGQMLDQRATLEARRALIYSNLSIAEVGFSIGFSDPAYFSRFFQRNTGLSPRQYRQSHGERRSPAIA